LFCVENARCALNVTDRSKFCVMFAINDACCSTVESKLTEFLFRRMAIHIESNNDLTHFLVTSQAEFENSQFIDEVNRQNITDNNHLLQLISKNLKDCLYFDALDFDNRFNVTKSFFMLHLNISSLQKHFDSVYEQFSPNFQFWPNFEIAIFTKFWASTQIFSIHPTDMKVKLTELNMRFALMEKLFVVNLDVLHPKFKNLLMLRFQNGLWMEFFQEVIHYIQTVFMSCQRSLVSIEFVWTIGISTQHVFWNLILFLIFTQWWTIFLVARYFLY